mmetsp:Transcript_25476/g.85576  ORF Transcript_25476/g.85576 Transcript_25476/m.85576 type:complete len:314 (-) Transcript_25476:596-1537(-)
MKIAYAVEATANKPVAPPAVSAVLPGGGAPGPVVPQFAPPPQSTAAATQVRTTARTTTPRTARAVDAEAPRTIASPVTSVEMKKGRPVPMATLRTWDPAALATAASARPDRDMDTLPRTSGIWAPQARSVAPASAGERPRAKEASCAVHSAALASKPTQINDAPRPAQTRHFASAQPTYAGESQPVSGAGNGTVKRSAWPMGHDAHATAVSPMPRRSGSSSKAGVSTSSGWKKRRSERGECGGDLGAALKIFEGECSGDLAASSSGTSASSSSSSSSAASFASSRSGFGAAAASSASAMTRSYEFARPRGPQR